MYTLLCHFARSAPLETLGVVLYTQIRLCYYGQLGFGRHLKLCTFQGGGGGITAIHNVVRAVTRYTACDCPKTACDCTKPAQPHCQQPDKKSTVTVQCFSSVQSNRPSTITALSTVHLGGLPPLVLRCFITCKFLKHRESSQQITACNSSHLLFLIL